MPWNIKLALWLTTFLCPEIGANRRQVMTSPPPSLRRSAAPDFVPDRDLAAADRAFRRYPAEDIDEEIAAEWAEYCARQESTRHHLFRCLNK
jgi:hypothetical protein